MSRTIALGGSAEMVKGTLSPRARTSCRALNEQNIFGLCHIDNHEH